MVVWKSCSWCHDLVESSEEFCPSCGHCAQKPRLYCSCAKCRAQRAAYDACIKQTTGKTEEN
jgi:hypothetical protein